LWLTVSEPKRGAMAETFTPEPIGPTLGFLASQRTFVILLAGFCLTTYTNYATSAWIPPFLARVHHLSSAEIGTYAGTFKGLCGIAGTLLGGLRGGPDRPPRRSLEAVGARDHVGPRGTGVCAVHADIGLHHDGGDTGRDLVPGRLHLGPIFAIAQTVAKPSMRALASAIMLLTAAGFGQGDRPARGRHAQRRAEERFGAQAVRYSLLSAAVTTTVGALLFIWAARSIRADIQRAS
jgi:hypothetical protein